MWLYKVSFLLLFGYLWYCYQSISKFDNQASDIDSEQIKPPVQSEPEEHHAFVGRGYREWIDKEMGTWYFPEFYTCNFLTNNCMRKDVFPVYNIEIVGYFLLFIQLTIANVSGIGGGYFSIIILFEVFRFEWTKWLSLAAYMNLLASIIRFIFFFKTRHPTKSHHTLIDYEIVIWFLPLTILGILLGHVIYGILPTFVIAVVHAAFWGMVSLELTYRTYTYIIAQTKKVKLTLSPKKREHTYNDLLPDKDSEFVDLCK